MQIIESLKTFGINPGNCDKAIIVIAISDAGDVLPDIFSKVGLGELKDFEANLATYSNHEKITKVMLIAL